jgi:regulator of Ty1 transposition protein 103
MSVYSDSVLKQKFDKLENTQPSITGLSQWILYHRKRHSESVDIWLKEFLAVSSEKKLILLYLANDVLQESRRKGDEFIKDFEQILEEVVTHLFKMCASAQVEKAKRLLTIWENRTVFPPNFIQLVLQKAQQNQVDKKHMIQSMHTNLEVNSNLESMIPEHEGYEIKEELLGPIHDSEGLLEQMLLVLAELRDAKRVQKELESAVKAISSGAATNEKLELIRQGDLSEVNTYSVQLDEDNITIKAFKESIENTIAINKRVAHVVELFHIAQRKEMEGGYRTELTECSNLSNSIGILLQKVQQVLDKHEIVLTNTALQPILQPSTQLSLKRGTPQTTTLSQYKKQKIENPSGSLINDIL